MTIGVVRPQWLWLRTVGGHLVRADQVVAVHILPTESRHRAGGAFRVQVVVAMPMGRDREDGPSTYTVHAGADRDAERRVGDQVLEQVHRVLAAGGAGVLAVGDADDGEASVRFDEWQAGDS